MINQGENSVAQNIETQTQIKTQYALRGNIMFLITIGIVAIGFVLDLASLGTDTLTIAISTLYQPDFTKTIKLGAASGTVIETGTPAETVKYDQQCRDASDPIFCELYHRGAAWIALRCVSIVVSLIAGGLIISLLINSSKVEALFKSKKNQYLVITICIFVNALLQIISVMAWLIDSSVNKETQANGFDVNIGPSVAITIVTMVFNLGSCASLLFMYIKKNLDF